ncbi:MAG: carboxylesterase/lipase family protein [Deltaproteobacteria bacterium]|nr:carboxylesterase/lipase family protein [Deltaproteobacteria bacterium]
MTTTVETTLGRLRGVEDAGLHVFRGVPFAQPPVDELRFRAPQAAEPWSGVRDASSFARTAPQGERAIGFLPAGKPEERSEDCLYLNVFTPGADDARRPVLFWIHGGGFTGGSGSGPMYDGAHLARRGDVVVVTINYRLGALGFLDLAEDGDANAGLLDQIAALEWVRDNIARFGGDPGNVTIFGESAGGMSVGTLMGTPAARGLFHRAIPQSGAAHNVQGRESAARTRATLLAELGLDSAAGLRDVPVADLVAAQTKTLMKARSSENIGMAFTPVLDGDVLPRPPLDAIREGSARGVDVLVGTTRDEWNLFRLMDPGGESLDEAGALKRLSARVAEPQRNAERVYETYRKAREGRSSTEPIEVFTAIETDRVFRIPAIRLAEAQRAHTDRVFKYLFSWESKLLDGRLGSCHALELPFVFGTLGLKGLQGWAGKGPDAERLSQRMMDAWLAFARTGDPASGDLPDWPAYDEERRATLVFDRQVELRHAPCDEERRAWDGLL